MTTILGTLRNEFDFSPDTDEVNKNTKKKSAILILFYFGKSEISYKTHKDDEAAISLKSCDEEVNWNRVWSKSQMAWCQFIQKLLETIAAYILFIYYRWTLNQFQSLWSLFVSSDNFRKACGLGNPDCGSSL